MKYTTFFLVLAGIVSACSKDNSSQAAASATPSTPYEATPAVVPPETALTDPNAARTPVILPGASSDHRDMTSKGTVEEESRISDPVRESQAGSSDALTQPGVPSPDGNPVPKDLATDSSPAKPKDVAPRLGTMDQEFVTKAPLIGAFLVESSELAVLQATTPFVREFAQMLVMDHGDANRELEELLRGKGTTLTKELDAEHQARLATLREKQGVEFDRQYRDIQVSELNDAISLFDRAANDCEDADLKAFAAKLLPILRAHQAKLSEMPPTSAG